MTEQEKIDRGSADSQSTMTQRSHDACFLYENQSDVSARPALFICGEGIINAYFEPTIRINVNNN